MQKNSSLSFLSVLEALDADEVFLNARPEYQRIYIKLLTLAQRTPELVKIRWQEEILEVGELCQSLIEISQLCGSFCDKSLVENCLNFWAKKGFLRQRIRQRKSVINISFPKFYEWVESELKTSFKTSNFNVATKNKTKNHDTNDCESNTCNGVSENLRHSLRHRNDDNVDNVDNVISKAMSSMSLEHRATLQEISLQTTPPSRETQLQHNIYYQDVERDIADNGDIAFSSNEIKNSAKFVSATDNPFCLSNDQLQTLEWLKSQQINTDEKTLSFWAKTYTCARLKDVFKHAKTKAKSNVGGYMNNLLKKSIKVECDTVRENREYAASIKELNSWNQLIIGDMYVTCSCGDNYVKEIPLSYTPAAFRDAIGDLFAFFQAYH